MLKRNTRAEFVALFLFLVVSVLVITNGFSGRIAAQDKEVDIYSKIQPIGPVLNTILMEYVRDPDVDKLVEGALVGMMNSLDKRSSYISPEILKMMSSETKGEFEGIGVSIQLTEDKNISVWQTIPESPASKVGVQAGDIIIKIDGVSTSGMALDDAAKRIRGPKDSVVRLTVYRKNEENGNGVAKPKNGEKEPPASEVKDFTIKRGNVPLDSIKEARLLPNNIGYVRIGDFKENTGRDLAKNLERLLQEGMKSLVVDLRWNPGGLLTSSKDVSELFLPKNTLVVYTQGRKTAKTSATENMKLYTERAPVLPEGFPMVVLANDQSASAAEIVTGALQFWKRAIVVGEKTYGKGSVQTIIPLEHPEGAALRLTTALYYTPAEVTIDGAGIKPDVEVPMNRKQQLALVNQMYESIKSDSRKLNQQNHGSATGDTVTAETIEDLQLKRACEILLEDPIFENLVTKYHKDTHETQVAAPPDKVLSGHDAADDTPEDAPEAPEEAPTPGPENKTTPEPQTTPVPPTTPTPAPTPAPAPAKP